MGMYTELLFRAKLHHDTPPGLLDWFDCLADDTDGAIEPYDDHPFFRCHRWYPALVGRGAVYQVSGPLQFTRGTNKSYEPPELVVHSSFKNYHDEVGQFVDWIALYVDARPGDFLGYSLYEDSRGWDEDMKQDREWPELIFMPPRKPTAD